MTTGDKTRKELIDKIYVLSRGYNDDYETYGFTLEDLVDFVICDRKAQAKRLLDTVEERVIQMNEKPDVQLAPNAFIYSGECEARNNLRAKQREILKELREELK